jgi:hypothetical protein
MAVLKFTIAVGKGEDARAREVTIDGDEVPLGLLEDLEVAQETRKWKDIRAAIGGFLGLTDDEFRAITIKQFLEISTAIQGATSIPNGQE